MLNDWFDKAKRFSFQAFMLALLLIAIIKVLIEELHGFLR